MQRVPCAVPSSHLCRSAWQGTRNSHQSSEAEIPLSPACCRPRPEFPRPEWQRKGCNTEISGLFGEIWGCYPFCIPVHFWLLVQERSATTTICRRRTRQDQKQLLTLVWGDPAFTRSCGIKWPHLPHTLPPALCNEAQWPFTSCLLSFRHQFPLLTELGKSYGHEDTKDQVLLTWFRNGAGKWAKLAVLWPRLSVHHSPALLVNAVCKEAAIYFKPHGTVTCYSQFFFWTLGPSLPWLNDLILGESISLNAASHPKEDRKITANWIASSDH